MAPLSPRPPKKVPIQSRKKMQKAMHLVAKYDAIVVAIASSVAIVQSAFPRMQIKDIVEATMEQMALEEGALDCEIEFFDIVKKMSRREKLYLIFAFLDVQHTEQVTTSQLEAALRKLRIHQEYPSAESLVEIFGSMKGANVLLRSDFESVIDALAASSVDCDWDQMVHLLFKCILFSASGSEIVEENVVSIVGKSGCNLDEAIAEARMGLLFKAMDETQSGYVLLKHLVRSLYRLTKDMDEKRRESLLMLTDKTLRKLDYEMFSEVIISINENFRDSTIDEVANEISFSMTSRYDVDDEEVDEVFVDNNFLQRSFSSFSSIESSSCDERSPMPNWPSSLGSGLRSWFDRSKTDRSLSVPDLS